MDARSEPKDVTRLLAELIGGNEDALRDLMPLVYSELKRLAFHYLRGERGNHTLQATALVHEAYLRLVGQKEARWQNREQFVRLAASMMRRILVDYSRSHRAAKRGGCIGKIFLEEASFIAGGKAAEVVAVDDALNRLSEFDPQQARVVELRFFGGLSIEETASVLGTSPATVKRNWNVAKAWLARDMRSHEDARA
ncbi:MAG TPA: sigma-70 family RNA polymerase sigma factor [Candidatus Acidoferrales bacterium]|nr:sigma-70 family RNA polymerase sigma factor [Candidatus Acidoferrales bacterium]